MNTNKVCEPNADAPEISDIANLWTAMWFYMGGQPDDEPDRRTVAAWFAAGECPPERLADANEQLGSCWAYCPARTASIRPTATDMVAARCPPGATLKVQIVALTDDAWLAFEFMPQLPSIESEIRYRIVALAQHWTHLDPTSARPFPCLPSCGPGRTGPRRLTPKDGPRKYWPNPCATPARLKESCRSRVSMCLPSASNRGGKPPSPG